MSQLLLINPIKKGKTIMKKRRTAAQKAATKRMLAANRARRGTGAKRTAKRRKTGTSVSVRSNPVGLARVAKRRSVRSARRRNPIASLSVSGIKGMVKEGVLGGAGALLVNTASNYLPVPAALKMGMGKSAIRAVLAVALGVVGGKVLPRGIAQSMAVGALTVAAHDMMLAAASKAAPSLLLGDIAFYDPEGNDPLDGMGVFTTDDDGMGAFVNQDFSS